ncbi:MAG: DNA replication/repair protein RecF [Myxococcales bacterium]|nr:DNA replication/repair protein RecF [Myxococcales bacterium]
MRLLAVELADFRNVAGALVVPHPRCNVFHGDNGQGKTNLLEAIFLVGTLTSFRASRVEEMVRFGATFARARARVERSGLERLYEVEIATQPARKVARVDGKSVRATADYFGGFNVVLFAPDDLQLPRGAPGERRRFLDRAVWNAEPALLREAQTYARLLKSRNALLRTPDAARLDDLLEVYDAQLAAAGAAIVARRRRYLGALAPRVAVAFERITKSGLPLCIGYRTRQQGSDGELAAELSAALRADRRKDFARGFTSAGPHADDLELTLDGRPAGLYGSQGQLRALVLALKIAEIEQLDEVLGDAPILLLDDVSSELDEARNADLFAFLREVRCQVFITTTHPAHVLLHPDPGARCDFRVTAGTIARS